jgi:hypothetical protein
MPVPTGSNISVYGAELVTVPYLTPASFGAFPTYAELDNLVTGVITAAANNAQLNNMLIESSQWVTDQMNMPAHAHIKVENKVMRPDRRGVLSLHAARNPVKVVTALQYAYDLLGTSFTVTDLSGQWIEESAQINLALPALNGSLNGIQLSPPGGSCSPLYTAWTYVAGFTNTTFAVLANAGSTTITVADPTGIVAGDRLRVWDPGLEESVTVAANYVVGSTSVPLLAATVNAHAVGASISQMPSTLQLAVVYYTCVLLMRPDSRAEDRWPDTRTGITTRSEDARRDGTGMIAEAYRQIRSYARVR